MVSVFKHADSLRVELSVDDIKLAEWAASETDLARRELRQAIHLILRAIAQDKSLAPIMIMKGGILLAIRYQSSRFTTDVDFSTPRHLQDIDLPSLLMDIQRALLPVSAANDYGLALSLQSHKINPPNRPEVSFPTLQLKIGYANRLNPNAMRRFLLKQAPKTIQIDYSFNEWVSEFEAQNVDGGVLNMYAYHDLIAEKLRSVLQQPIRERARFQDIYDLFLLVEGTTPTGEDKQAILEKLHAACADRKVPLFKYALRQQDVIEYSKKEYGTIAALIKDPPKFDLAYRVVQEFFEDLPWSDDEIDKSS